MMVMMSISRSEQLADEHSEWFARFISAILKDVYREAFIHGYKHGRIDWQYSSKKR